MNDQGIRIRLISMQALLAFSVFGSLPCYAAISDGTEPVITTTPSTSITIGDISGGSVLPNLILMTNGAERARIDGSGNVGIGSAPLSGFRFRANGSASMGNRATIGRSGNQYDEYGFNIGFTATADAYTYQGTDFAASIRMGNGGSIEFRTAPSGTAGTALTLMNRMQLTQAGKLGIGTTSPIGRATIAETGGIQLVLSQSNGATDLKHKYLQSTGGSLYFGRMTDAQIPTDQMTLTNSGKLGIGTTNPAATLALFDPAGAIQLIQTHGAAGADLKHRYIQTQNGGMYFGKLNDAMNATDQMMLSNSGKLGLGTTNPAAKLHASEPAGALQLVLTHSGAAADLKHKYMQSQNGSLYFGKLNDAMNASDQMVLSNSGKLGIGYTNPAAKLHASEPGGAIQFVLTHSGAGADLKHKYIQSVSGSLYFGKMNDALNATDQMVLTNSGRLGIGTANPGSQFSVVGTSDFKGPIDNPALTVSGGPSIGYSKLQSVWNLTPTTENSAGNLPFMTSNWNNGSGFGFIEAANVSSPVAWMYEYGGRNAFTVAKKRYQDNTKPNPTEWIEENLIPLFQVRENGRVGIGITNPEATLHVAGNAKIDAGLTVASITTKVWSIAPDYVFDDDYELAPLEHVEQYVKKNKHLPEVPSAKVFKEKGMDIAEMNFLLLKKVEELTLHAIRQEKEMKRQAEEIRQMKLMKQ